MHEGYISTDSQRLSVLCLLRAQEAIVRTSSEPQQWFLAIPDLHRALNCAFVAALRGTAGIGAYGPKLRAQWLEYFENSRTQQLSAPTGQKVESFTELLRRAQLPSPDLQGEPLKLCDEQLSDLNKLNDLRDDIEHVKPDGGAVQVAGLPRICRAAAYALSYLYSLPPVFVHLTDQELMAARRAVDTILKFGVAEAPN
jgi:hypothetical protein